MTRFCSCFRGGASSSNAMQGGEASSSNGMQGGEASSSTAMQGQEASSSNAVQGRQGVHDDEPFGNNNLLNHLWRSGRELPDDRELEDPNDTVLPILPALPANCGLPYQWQEILDGTQNLGETLYLGRGNFGKVYRCHFSRTKEDAAVKIQDRTNPTAQDEFVAEVMTLHAANHQNVIRLLGRYYGLRNHAIVYEFMPNGSLNRHIFVHEKQSQGTQGLQQPTEVLDWERRMKIAVGVAQGLVYIHQELKVIHRDVKAENILLDANFVPKLANFGLATRFTVSQHGVEQECEICPVKGTPGWIAPETEQNRFFSTKSDVYSYGVFLFVLFTGRKANDPQKSLKIADWVMHLWTSSKYEPVDVALGHNYSVEGLTKIYETARKYINLQPHARPAMSEVETKVREAATFPVPKVEKRRLSF